MSFSSQFSRLLLLAITATATPFLTPIWAAPATEMKADGTIVIGGSTRIIINDTGLINITRDNGDRYEGYIPLTLLADGKWFSTMHLDNRNVTLDAAKQTAIFRGSFKVPNQAQSVPMEISVAAQPENKVRITVRYLTDVPIKNILSSYYMLFQAPRPQFSGREVKVNEQKTVLSTEGPSDTGDKILYGGTELPVITYFPDDTERRVTITPVQAGAIESFDYNRLPQPIVGTRYYPKDNAFIFDVGFSGEAKVASPETYYGVDYWAANKFRLPRYGVSRNLVQNSGFEGGFHGWRRSGRGMLTSSKIDNYYEIQNGGAFAGNRSLKLIGEKGQSASHLTSFAIPVETGAEYTLSFYARAERPNFPINVSSTTAEWPVFTGKDFSIGTEWKRYVYTFKAPNEMLTADFGIPRTDADGVAWIDNVQLEKGPLTDYTEKPVGASLVTNARGNWLQPNEKTGARLELFGKPQTSGSAAIKMTDFFGKTVREETRPFTLGADGTAQLPMAYAEGLEAGLYLIETNLKAGEFSDRDFSRLTIMPYADGTAPHKKLFAYGAEGWEMGEWSRRLDFYKRAGIGSAIIFDVGPNKFFQTMQQNGIVDVTSIFEGGTFTEKRNLKKDYHFTDEQLKVVENLSYEKAKAYPEILYWKTVNEPGDKMSANMSEMKEFVKTQVAAYRGIKRANPKAVVISPDPANMAPQSGIQWLDMFLEAGGKAACDVIAIHPYRPRPEEPDMDSDVATLIQMLDKHGYKGEIWFTEGMGNFTMNLPAWGIDVHGALSQEAGKSAGWRVGHLSYDLGYGERMAAAYAMRFWLIGLKYGDRVKQQVNWYYFYNSTLDYDMTPGAEVFATNTLTKFLGDSSFKQDLELGEGVRGYLFEDGKKQPVAVIWNHDIRVDKGEVQGPLVDISALPAGNEIFDFTGKKVARTKELRISSFPIFIRGAIGNTAALAKTLEALPMNSATARQLIPQVKLTGAQSAEIQLRNLLARPVAGHLQVTQAGKLVYDENITVAGKATWAKPISIARETGKLTAHSVQVNFKPANGVQPQVSELKLETFAIPRAVKPPTVDGELSDWPTELAMPFPNRIITFDNQMPKYGGATDLSGTFYSAWDNENLYLAFNIKDDKFAISPQSNAAWQGDGVQIYFDSFQNAKGAIKPNFDSDDQNFDLWPNPNGMEVRRVITPDVQLAFLKAGVVESAKKSFKRTADGYIMELAIPARELAPAQIKAGESFGFSFIINDKDDEIYGRKRGMTLTPEGTEPYNHPELFTIVTLKP